MPTNLIVYYSIDENQPPFPFKFEEDTFGQLKSYGRPIWCRK